MPTDRPETVLERIDREAWETWMNSLRFSLHVAENYDSSMKGAGAKVGTTIAIRLPNRYTQV